MTDQMQYEVIRIATIAIEKFKVERDVATFIKEEFDKKYTPSWHCVVGRNFGSYVTHESNHFIYFYTKHMAIMLFKTTF
uniref:Dynein light chain n=1 Tax=Steinernema glaseri TaxID=37863 RepID=A0A1I7ZKV6_9BILA